MKKSLCAVCWLLLFLVLCLNVTSLIVLATSSKTFTIGGEVSYSAPANATSIEVKEDSSAIKGYSISMGYFPQSEIDFTGGGGVFDNS